MLGAASPARAPGAQLSTWLQRQPADIQERVRQLAFRNAGRLRVPHPTREDSELRARCIAEILAAEQEARAIVQRHTCGDGSQNIESPQPRSRSVKPRPSWSARDCGAVSQGTLGTHCASTSPVAAHRARSRSPPWVPPGLHIVHTHPKQADPGGEAVQKPRHRRHMSSHGREASAATVQGHMSKAAQQGVSETSTGLCEPSREPVARAHGGEQQQMSANATVDQVATVRCNPSTHVFTRLTGASRRSPSRDRTVASAQDATHCHRSPASEMAQGVTSTPGRRGCSGGARTLLHEADSPSSASAPVAPPAMAQAIRSPSGGAPAGVDAPASRIEMRCSPGALSAAGPRYNPGTNCSTRCGGTEASGRCGDRAAASHLVQGLSELLDTIHSPSLSILADALAAHDDVG
mmetsp:Transcript_19373/g.61494  ORF Transcript_19373/g.61494 Transcript_19373/m.61494 type:complete len:407 (-) Transcript_19373:343-1563(-)